MILTTWIGLPNVVRLSAWLSTKATLLNSFQELSEQISNVESLDVKRSFKIKNSNLWYLGIEIDGADGWGFVISPHENHFQIQLMPDSENFLASNGFFSNGRLVLAGRWGWSGNGPHPHVVEYGLDSGIWRSKQVQEGDFESEDPEFVLDGTKWIAGAKGGAYPLHMNVSHSMAIVEKTRRFIFSGGHLQPTQDVTLSSPMGILSEILERAHSGKSMPRSITNRAQRKLRFVLPELWTTGWRTDLGRPKDDRAVVFANSANLRFEFRRYASRWTLEDIRHGRGLSTE